MPTQSSDVLASKHALVLGATGGLGSEIAQILSARGTKLTLVGRDVERLQALDVTGERLSLDLRDPQACYAAVDEAVERMGSLDIVINAVGIVAFGPVTDLSIDAMEELFLTNTFLPIAVAKAALPALEPGGVLVNISGVVAERNLPGMAAYGASKAALRSFDEALAREARRHKVRVIDARPPHTETGLAARAIEGTAPQMPKGLDPSSVANVIVEAISSDVTDLGSEAFNKAA